MYILTTKEEKEMVTRKDVETAKATWLDAYDKAEDAFLKAAAAEADAAWFTAAAETADAVSEARTAEADAAAAAYDAVYAAYTQAALDKYIKQRKEFEKA